MEPRASAFYSQIPLNEGLWKQLQTLCGNPGSESLTGPHLRFLTKTLDSFRRHGAELDAEGKKRLAEIDVELTKAHDEVLGERSRFDECFRAGRLRTNRSWRGFRRARWRRPARARKPKGAEGWRFTLQAPSYIPVMTYLDDRAIREQIYRAFAARATEPERDNRPLIVRILELRREKAQTAGFRGFRRLRPA